MSTNDRPNDRAPRPPGGGDGSGVGGRSWTQWNAANQGSPRLEPAAQTSSQGETDTNTVAASMPARQRVRGQRETAPEPESEYEPESASEAESEGEGVQQRTRQARLRRLGEEAGDDDCGPAGLGTSNVREDRLRQRSSVRGRVTRGLTDARAGRRASEVVADGRTEADSASDGQARMRDLSSTMAVDARPGIPGAAATGSHPSMTENTQQVRLFPQSGAEKRG